MWTHAEKFTVSLLLLPALISIIGFATSLLGIPLSPITYGIIVLTTVCLIIYALRFMQPKHPTNNNAIIPLAIVLFSTFGYFIFLSYPSFLPLSSSTDMINHLVLIYGIVDYQTLPSTLSRDVVGHMSTYPPGIHLVIAAASTLFPSLLLRMPYLVMAYLTSLTAGLLYIITVRILGFQKFPSATALLLVLLLGVPHAYTISALIHHGFYSMVAGEAYTLGIVWALTVWRHHQKKELLFLCAFLAGAICITWPGWMGIVLAVLILTLKSKFTTVHGFVRNSIYALALPCAIGILYVRAYQGTLGGPLEFPGFVTVPSLSVLSPLLIIMALVGAITHYTDKQVSVIHRATAALIIQGICLGILAHMDIASWYPAYKTVYLLVYLAVIYAIVGIITTINKLPSPHIYLVLTGVFLLALLGVRGIPQEGQTPLVPELFTLGNHVQGTVPHDCVDYQIGNWDTAYWFHLVVLSNTPGTFRSNSIIKAPHEYYYDTGMKYVVTRTRNTPNTTALDTVGDWYLLEYTNRDTCEWNPPFKTASSPSSESAAF